MKMVEPLLSKSRGRNDSSLPISLLNILSYRKPATSHSKNIYYIILYIVYINCNRQTKTHTDRRKTGKIERQTKIQTDRDLHRQTVRQTDRDRDSKTMRQTNRQTDIWTEAGRQI